jgi:predicted aconitase
MNLTREEQEMLDGKYGDVIQKCMELLVAIGDSYDAERMIPISSAHLVSANPVTAGKGGAAFIKGMAAKGGKFLVTTTTNPASVEPWLWEEMRFGEDIYKEHIALSNAIAAMGGLLSNTCTPYLLGHFPRKGEHVAWGESSAVLYLNAVVGARTNREGGPSALAAAITGRTPAYGYHLEENRHGEVKFINKVDLECDTDYMTLGYFIGKISGDRVPIITGIPSSISQDEIKCLGTPFAVTGGISHYHVVGATPEAETEEAASGNKRISVSNTFEFGLKELKETEESLCAIGPEKVNLVILGCPHASITQLKKYAKVLSGRRVKEPIEIWILTMSSTKKYAKDIGIADIIESAGAKLVTNTCPGAMPRNFFIDRGFNGVATDSPKMAYYVTTTKSVPCYYGRLEKFIDIVTKK